LNSTTIFGKHPLDIASAFSREQRALHLVFKSPIMWKFSMRQWQTENDACNQAKCSALLLKGNRNLL